MLTVITAKEVAKMLGVEPKTMREWEESKGLKIYDFKTAGGHRRYYRESIDDIILQIRKGKTLEQALVERLKMLQED